LILDSSAKKDDALHGRSNILATASTLPLPVHCLINLANAQSDDNDIHACR